MLEIDWDEETGWKAPVISAYHNLEIDPRNSTLHYAIQLFEGMKAYKNKNKLVLFRPDMNMKRLLVSAERIGLPSFDTTEFMKCIEDLLKIDKDWIPEKTGYSIYIRPTFISMTNVLGVSAPKQAKLFVILAPVAGYFNKGFEPVNIICSENIVRSWPGGFGYAKLGANYGPTLQYFKEIKNQKYDQILWLINDIVTEVGVMNFFVYWTNKSNEKELITCPLDGTILPGVTRDSVIQMAKSWNIKVSEKHYTIQDVMLAQKENRIIEAFGTGTAAVICPIKSISYKGEKINLNLGKEGKVGDLSKKLYEHISDIHYGRVLHPFWSKIVNI
jgi:branched-chain amino acid aminotransferase